MKLKLYANLRDIVGKDEVEMELKEPILLNEFLRDISNDYGDRMRKFLLKESNEISDSLILSINDNLVMKRESTYLSNKDELSILVPLAGG